MNFLDQIIDEKQAFAWIEQGTFEWDRIRVGRFTASQNWKLIVEPKEKSKKISETTMTYIMEKVAEVMTGQCKQQGYAYPLVYGTEQEPIARDHFASKTGYEVQTVGFFPYTDHAGGSPDGIVNDRAILEIKCPYDSKVMLDYLMLTDQWDLKRNFREYYWQCVNNMVFTGKEFAYFVAFDPRMTKEENKMKVIELELKPDERDLVIEKIPVAVDEKLKLLALLQ
jgi:hypothetical protein